MSIESKKMKSSFYMKQMTKFDLGADETFTYNERAFHCLLVVTKGAVKCSLFDDLVWVKGDSILLSCERLVQLKSMDDDTQGYMMEFQEISESSVFHSIAFRLGSRQIETVRLRPFSNQALKLDKLFQNLDQTTIELQLANQIVFQNMLQSVIEAYKFNRQTGDTILNVQLTISYIRQFYMRKITIAMLAQQANVSERQYLRVFKKLTGKNPIDYINQYRINRAQEQLLQTVDTVHKIAANVGVDDVNYFNRLFKQSVGCAPKEYICLRRKDSKIATIHYVAELLALGIKPIADINTSLSQLPVSITDIVSVGERTCNVHKLEGLNPDIVITSDAIAVEIREQIKQFVPVIVIPWDLDPIERLQRIAKVLGQSARAKACIAEFEKERTRVKRVCAEQFTIPESASILRLDEQKVWIPATRFYPTFYEVLGFSPSELMLRTTERYQEQRTVGVPLERISEIESDRIYIILGKEHRFNEWLKQLISNKDWKRLRAVRNNQVFLLRHKNLENSIYSLRGQLKEAQKIRIGQPSQSEEDMFLGNLMDFLEDQNIGSVMDRKRKGLFE